MRKLILLLPLAIGLGSPAAAQISINGAPQDPLVQSQLVTANRQLNHKLGILRSLCQTFNGPFVYGTVGTDNSATGRTKCYNKGALTTIQLGMILGGQNVSGSEGSSPYPYIVRATSETQAGQLYRHSRSGSYDLVIGLGGNGSPTLFFEPLGFYQAANSFFYNRIYVRVATPPAATSATAFAGGYLTASTTYYYKLTTVDTGLESGPSSEVTCTPATLNLSCNVVWTAPKAATLVPAATCAINIYRSTTTNTEKFLAQVPCQSLNYVDSGTDAGSTTATPPAQTAIPLMRFGTTGESGNTPSGSGDGSDQTATTGAISGLTGPTGGYIEAPGIVLGDDTANPAILGLGDSIMHAAGIPSSQRGDFALNVSNWFDYGLNAAGITNRNNYSIGGARVNYMTTNTTPSGARFLASTYADYAVSNLVINDLFASRTWQQVAADHLLLAKQFQARGTLYYVTTCTPSTTSTDAWSSASSQTVGAIETNRTNWNLWVRGGMLVDGSGAPVLSSGTPNTYIAGYFDLAAPVEVNSSNVLTNNGGFWKAPASAAYTGTLTGSPTTTVLPCSACSFPVAGAANSGILTYAVKITSGAANGQVAYVTSGTTATSLTLYANGSTQLTGSAMVGLTTAPAAGDTFSVYAVNTVDGTHGTYSGYTTLMGPAFGTWAAVNLPPYGPMQ